MLELVTHAATFQTPDVYWPYGLDNYIPNGSLLRWIAFAFLQGVDVVVGRTDSDLCPVAAILAYIAARRNCQGPFFLAEAGTPLTKPNFIADLRRVLAAAGLPQDDYAGHSFRIGAATSAALAGVEDSTIQLLGRWQSSAFLRYVRTPQARLAEVSKALAAHGQPGRPGSQ